jgi:hypothetical protein
MRSLFTSNQFNTLALHLAAPSAWVSKLNAANNSSIAANVPYKANNSEEVSGQTS